MSQENVDLVRSIHTAWERGDYGADEWYARSLRRGETTRRVPSRISSRLLLSSLVGVSVVCAYLPSPASAATATVGQVAPPGSKSKCSGCTTFQYRVGAAPLYSVPSGDWTITSWSTRGGPIQDTARLRVFRHTGTPNQYKLVAQSCEETVPPGFKATFATNIPVHTRDVLGLRTGAASSINAYYAGGEGDVARGVGGDPSIGQIVGDAPGNFQWIEFEPARVNVAATLESPGPGTGPEPCNSPSSPSNTFSFADVLKNKQKGTVKLVVVVPGPGTLELAKTKKVKGADERASAEGEVQLPIEPKGKARKKLNKKGKAKVTAEVTYTPDGGTPSTESKRIKLVKR